MYATYVLFPPFYNSVLMGDCSDVTTAKYGDFGLSLGGKAGTLRAGKTYCGTDRYIAPELERGEEKDLQYQAHSADVFSLGMTVVEYIVGEEEFDKLVSPKPINTSTGEKFKASELFASLKEHGVSASGIDLLSRMIDANPATRISAVGAMGHRWLSKCDNPYLKEGAEEHRWVFYQADRVEKLRIKNAELQEKVTVLEEQVSETTSAIDGANKEASELNKHFAELQVKDTELEKQLKQAAAEKTEIEQASHLLVENREADILALVKTILKVPNPFGFEMFLSYDTFHNDVNRYGSLLVFALLFEARWKERRHHDSLEKFLVTYGKNLDKVHDFLHEKAAHGKKYYGKANGYPKRALDKDDEAARKQSWKAIVGDVAKEIHSKSVDGGIDSANTFSAALEIIRPVVDAVFDETAPFEEVTENCRHSFAVLLAAIHIGATSADSEA
jgi:hypothetical protein